MPMLSWIGKEKVVNHHLAVAVRELRRSYSFDGSGPHEADGGSENKIIHGDSLDALKALLPQYEGRVKCIYLDPPYNTGNEGWVYNDNVNDPHIQKWLGDVVGKEGEDFSRHDKWLCMMYPRLKLVQKLLSEDGAVFISIDDVEFANLKLTCDEVFGSANFLVDVIWQHSIQPKGYVGTFSLHHNHTLVYQKSCAFLLGTLDRTDEDNKAYRNPDNDPRGLWRSGDVRNALYRPNLIFDIVSPNGNVIHAPEKGWRWCRETIEQKISTGEIVFNADQTGIIRKIYLDTLEGRTPESIWFGKDVGTTREANSELKEIFGGAAPFDTPKPTRLIERILQIASDKNSIVLDCFAGSGTTAHAVLKQNAKDGGNRRFILVEMCDYAESVTAERVKRVIKGYGEGKNAVAGTGGDFSFYEIGEPLFVGEALNPAADIEAVKDYIWFSETRTARRECGAAGVRALPECGGGAAGVRALTECGGGAQGAARPTEDALLGVNFGTAYYFWHDAAQPVVLNRKSLHAIKTKAESYVIYADLCALGAAELEKFHITFKKVSRDIVKI